MAGQEVICDAICSQNLSNEEVIELFAREVIDGLDLHCEHMYTKVFKNGTTFGPGITSLALLMDQHVNSLVLLSESHLTIHTTPETQKLYLNVFSCKAFEDEIVKSKVFDTFGVERMIRWLVLQR